MIRTFVAMEIPRMIELSNLLEGLRRSGSKLSVPKDENIHVTLKFIGDVREDEASRILGGVAEVATDCTAFDAKVVGTGAFPAERNPRVLWVGIEDGGSMSKIADAIDERLSRMGFERERRAFTPHVTVARVKSPSGLDRAMSVLRGYDKTDFGSFVVADIRLKKSTLTPNGSIYEDLGVIPLKAPDMPRK